MSNSTSSSTSGGIGVFGLLGVSFVILKLCHVMAWSWWWVLAPFWGPLAFLLAILALWGVGALLVVVWVLLRRLVR